MRLFVDVDKHLISFGVIRSKWCDDKMILTELIKQSKLTERSNQEKPFVI